jgi:hypothetical protein
VKVDEETYRGTTFCPEIYCQVLEGLLEIAVQYPKKGATAIETLRAGASPIGYVCTTYGRWRWEVGGKN